MSKIPPPRLHFDDGSRVIIENSSPSRNHVGSRETTDIVSEVQARIPNPRGTTPLVTYYEINRIANEIVDHIHTKPKESESDGADNQTDQNTDGFFCKVALQFPDELLDDSAEVTWLMEEAIETTANEKSSEDDYQKCPPLVFILGDTTYSSCCPDEIGALHLNADVIVHFGQYACLSPSQCLPVLYSFGVLQWTGLDECVNTVMQRINNDENESISILLLCERRYHQYMNDISNSLTSNSKVQAVLIGSVPNQHNDKWMKMSCCGNEPLKGGNQLQVGDGVYIGGLFLPIKASSISNYTLLYIGDDSGSSKSRQFLNTVLRCSSPKNGAKKCWSYNPETKQLSTDPYSILGVSRYLNRRFFLTQKAQLASIIGILVGTLSQDRFRNMIATVRRKIQDSGRGCYTFVVGKINVAKLANFAEIECFVLISCEETSVLEDERDFHVPVIAPTELDIVLGEKAWSGSDSCNTDFNEYLRENEIYSNHDANVGIEDETDDIKNADDCEEIVEDDEPFFSMITGTYMSKPTPKQSQLYELNDKNETQMVEYKSEAAEFLRNREYKGLEAKIGQTEVRAAIEGQTGIASDYGK